MPKYLTLQPNQKIAVAVTFNCSHENAIIVEAHSSGKAVFQANSHSNNPLSGEIGPNAQKIPVVYRIRGVHKNSAPNARKPWHDSLEKVIFANASSMVIGFEDGNDGDFNDAVATIIWHR